VLVNCTIFHQCIIVNSRKTGLGALLLLLVSYGNSMFLIDRISSIERLLLSEKRHCAAFADGSATKVQGWRIWMQA